MTYCCSAFSHEMCEGLLQRVLKFTGRRQRKLVQQVPRANIMEYQHSCKRGAYMRAPIGWMHWDKGSRLHWAV
jgi:hypothetical protein